MFATLKNKIKEETGNDASNLIAALNRSNSMILNNNSKNLENCKKANGNASATTAANQPNQFTSTSAMVGSPIDQLNAIISQKKAEIATLNDKLNEAQTVIDQLADDKAELAATVQRLENENHILEETVKVAQVQKELIHSEQDKIQNLQSQEITKLKSLLHFREQEAVDRLSTIKQKENQLEQCQSENTRLRDIEANFENVQDELEKLRHSAQLEKSGLTASLASVEEKNRHLMSKLQIYEEGRINFTVNQTQDEKIQTLVRERRMLEQRLEEAHLHLSDVKGTWSAQNMALETQLDRLSRQVAAETTEKRKALKAQDELAEKCKQIQFQLEKTHGEIEQRDQKIKLLSEEIDDLSSTFREYQDENEEEVTFLRNKVNKSTDEIDKLKESLRDSAEQLTIQADDSEKLMKSLYDRIDTLQQELNDVRNMFENEKQEKNTILLKNAEISQNEERLKQELRNESNEMSELYETIQSVQTSLQAKTFEAQRLNEQRLEIEQKLNDYQSEIERIEDLKNEINDKNKTIKMLNQRLSDMKKTLQNELKINGSSTTTVAAANNTPSDAPLPSHCENGTNGTIPVDNKVKATKQAATTAVVMDDVNFKYLKHVILKFLTSREVEARHLIKAIGTLLNLSKDEEQLLHETLNFKVSWFGTRTTDVATRTRQHRLFSIPSMSSSSMSS